MRRFTERHDGVAVIRNKALHKETMEQLAQFEEIGIDPEELKELHTPRRPKDGGEVLSHWDDEGNPVWIEEYACPKCGMEVSGEYICCPYCRQSLSWVIDYE